MEESEVAKALIAYTRLVDVVGEAEHNEIVGPFVFIFSNQQDMERFLIEIVDHRRYIIFCLLPLQPVRTTRNVRRLKHLCRLRIRDCMGRLRLRASVFMSFLPLPRSLKDYILFREYDLYGRGSVE
ncbi:hypothetical protein SKAU_G00059360 [Synaphobranchus kaupii]|uniref:SOCS box domain-containing protein n=1 Tax=Synaphobranchus kaupii TaxID=118154 RepID=A0A9Q1G522_SYNKA|nr:hypothetical protein SKAU_G00059360 [Synaphobranchus kaupii]